MARGRIFKWVDPAGNSLLLSDYMNGFRVLRGVLGLGLPTLAIDKEDLPDRDSYIVRGVRGSGRQIFLPLEIWATSRQNFLNIKRNLAYMMDPQRGPGTLYITDAGATYRITGYYAGGLEGDETVTNAGEDGAGSWVSTSITIDCQGLWFEQVSKVVIGPYGYSGTVPFFPIMPLKLTPSQVLSDISQAAITNHVTNPGFEAAVTTGWGGNFFTAPVTIGTPTTVWAGAGSYSCRVDFPNAVGGTSGRWFTSGDGVPLVIGQKYTIKLRIMVPSGQPQIAIGAWDGQSAFNQTFDQPEWLISTFIASFSANPLLSIFQQPAGGANANGGFCYVDQGMLVNGGDPGGYIDGGQPNCHWNGTPNLSTSYRDPAYAPTIITNTGTKKTYPIFTVIGPGTQLDFFNRDTGEHVTLNYTIPAGRVVTVDMANYRVTLDDGTNLYNSLTADDFWGLSPGDNLVTLTLLGAAAGSYISGTFNPRLAALV